LTDEAIPILRVADASAAVSWYERLGYEKEWEHRFGPEFPTFASVVRQGSARLFLSEHEGDGSTPSVVYLRVDDVDAVAAEFGTAIVEQPWARETHLTDPDGNQLRVAEAG
jgi:hypothetical protein